MIFKIQAVSFLSFFESHGKENESLNLSNVSLSPHLREETEDQKYKVILSKSNSLWHHLHLKLSLCGRWGLPVRTWRSIGFVSDV